MAGIEGIFRPLAHYPPSFWGSSFSSSFPLHSEFEAYSGHVDGLKEKLKDMLMASSKDPAENIEFIYLLCRLGISYHFDNEIEELLNNIFNDLHNLLQNNDYGLSTISLLFLILRQYGFKMPSDAFNKFKDSDGKFKKSITDDVRGMLNLYEGSFLSVHGEDIMDEALAFARENLETLVAQASPPLAKHINNALDLPFHKCIPRLDARKYISFYQEDENRNEIALKFAMEDYNRVQLLHQRELHDLARWWKELNLVEKFPYARDRYIELYLWAVGSHFEPQYSLPRMMVSKLSTVISLLDDAYDAYGTPDELQRLTDAFERFDIAAMDELPDNIKLVYKTVLSTLDEVEEIMNNKGRPYCAYYAKEAFKELARSYHQEAKWFYGHHVPPLKEYLENGYGTSTYGVFPVASFIGMDSAGIKEFEWLKGNPKIAKATKIVGRLANDFVSHEDEQKRGECASGVECYMKEYCVEEKEAIKELRKLCANCWKDANEDCMKPDAKVTLPHLMVLVNLMRLTEEFYNHVDKYTKSHFLKEEISLLFIHNIAIE